jgi:hypothetical protein
LFHRLLGVINSVELSVKSADGLLWLWRVQM